MSVLFPIPHALADVIVLDAATLCRALTVACSTVQDADTLADALDAFLVGMDEAADQDHAPNLVTLGAWPDCLPTEALDNARHTATKACGDEPLTCRSEYEWSEREAAAFDKWDTATQCAQIDAEIEWRTDMRALLAKVERAVSSKPVMMEAA